jgi:hemoglobin
MPKPMTVLAVACALALAACTARERTVGRQASTSAATLYQDLGGEKGVARLVNRLLEKYKADVRINSLLDATDFDYFAARLNEYVCMRTGGGCVYQGLSMAQAHSGMAIREREFNYFVEDTQDAMDELGYSQSVQNQLLKILAHDQPEVVNQ